MAPADSIAYPFRVGPFRHTMGLAPLILSEWIEPDENWAADLAERARLLGERHSEVFAALLEAEASSREVLGLLAEHLPLRFPDLYRRDGGTITCRPSGLTWNIIEPSIHPLDLAGRMVQEDLCLMQQSHKGEPYRLVGASLCFPTRWRLSEKLGQSVNAIHGPVPAYDEQLTAAMDRFFERLSEDRPVWRANWSLLDDPTLFQPSGHGRTGQDPTITAQNAGERLWLRSERQTLRRLPRTRAVLFTIRVRVRPLNDLARRPEQAVLLAENIRAMPETMRAYKSLQPFLGAALAWLDHVHGRST
ncbi:MAG TPA: DUF3445 domain-containing protein [Candidatus Methylomirabilis sp.]|nr:DUF3445 domain-containing protein [Candidatus Methylomirabilis sp.]